MAILDIIRNLYYRLYLIPKTYKYTSQYCIEDSLTTIEYIIKNSCSVSRFGDGEFDVIMGGSRGFQHSDMALGKRLDEVLHSNIPNHIVCVPLALKDVSGMNAYAREFWSFKTAMLRKFIASHVDKNKKYYNTNFTRFYIDFSEKIKSRALFAEIKKIWEGRDIVIVEGSKTRSGVGNDLYSSAKSIKRIICPAENAYDKYDIILQSVQDYVPKDTLVLISLGMTATILAYDLSIKGYQAIDIGHLDIEYEWMIMDAKEKVAISGKYVNELGYSPADNCEDEDYQAQIVCRCGK